MLQNTNCLYIVLDNETTDDASHGFNGSIFIYVFVTIIACIICFNLVLGLGSCRFSFTKKQVSCSFFLRRNVDYVFNKESEDSSEEGTPNTSPPGLYTITVPECTNRITKPKTDSTSTQETNVSIGSSPPRYLFDLSKRRIK